MKDQDIVALYWERNENAITESQKEYGYYCMSVSMNILNSRPDAEECVNDTWLKAWQVMPPQRPNNLRVFLGKIVRNLSLDRFRTLHRQKRNIDLEVAMEELGEALIMPEETTTTQVSRAINEFLSMQDAVTRKLFVGRYWHGYSVARLAQHYGMAPNTVSQRLSRTRERLKAFLAERGYSV